MRLKTELEGANLGDERLNTRLNQLASLLDGTEVLDSEWAACFGPELVKTYYGKPDLRHFVLFGTDFVVEVLSVNSPTVKLIEGPIEIASICV